MSTSELEDRSQPVSPKAINLFGTGAGHRSVGHDNNHQETSGENWRFRDCFQERYREHTSHYENWHQRRAANIDSTGSAVRDIEVTNSHVRLSVRIGVPEIPFGIALRAVNWQERRGRSPYDQHRDRFSSSNSQGRRDRQFNHKKNPFYGKRRNLAESQR